MSLFGPLVAYVPTPLTPEGEVDEATLAVLVDRAREAGVGGVAVLGSTGGYAYLDRAARRRVAEVAAEALAGQVPLMVGVGSLLTRDVLSLAADAHDAGASAILLPPMSYLPLTEAEVVGLVETVAGATTTPVWIYHNPVTTRFDFSVELLVRLSAIPGVGGVKDRGQDTDGVRARARRLTAETSVEVGYSGDAFGYHGLLAGAVSWHSGLAGVLPRHYVEVAAAAASRDEALARERMRPLVRLAHLAATAGGARVVHAVGELLGLSVGVLPEPLRPPAPDVLAELAAELKGLRDEPPARLPQTVAKPW